MGLYKYLIGHVCHLISAYLQCGFNCGLTTRWIASRYGDLLVFIQIKYNLQSKLLFQTYPVCVSVFDTKLYNSEKLLFKPNRNSGGIAKVQQNVSLPITWNGNGGRISW